MASSWGEIKEAKGGAMLPEGTRMYTVTACRPEVNKRTERREAYIAVTSSEGSGAFEIPLEPWDENARDTWEKVFKGQAQGLGFVPTNGDTVPLHVAVTEFTTQYLPSLLNAQIELSVYHVASTKLKDDGTPFLNQRVYCNALLSKSAVAQATDGESGYYKPVVTSALADDDIVF